MRYRYGVILLVVQMVLTYFSFPNAQIPEANVLSAILIFFTLMPFFLFVLMYRGQQLVWFSGLSSIACSLPALLHTTDMSMFPIVGILIFALIAVLVGLMGAALGMGIRFLYESANWAFILLAPAMLTSLEFLRVVLVLHLWFIPPPNILFAYPLVGIPPLIQMSSITGIFGPGFLIFYIATAMALAIWTWVIKTPMARKIFDIAADVQPLDAVSVKKQWMAGIGIGLVLLILIAAGNIEAVKISKMQNTTEAVFKPALLQLQIDPSSQVNWNRQFRYMVLKKYRDLFQVAKEKQADVLVLTENALPVVLPRDAETWQDFLQLVREFELPAMVGLVTTLEENLSFDTWYWLDKTGEIHDHYNKRFLEPFGEYMPMRAVIDPILAGINTVFRKSYRYLKITAMPFENYDLTAGKEEKIFSITDKSQVSLKVCIEITIGKYFRESVQKGAQVFLSPSTSNWFVSPVDWNLGLEASRFRAVETRRWVGRSASMGATAAIDALGILRESTPFGQYAVMVPSMPLMNYKTFYVRFGDVFSWLCVGICLLFGGLTFFKRSH